MTNFYNILYALCIVSVAVVGAQSWRQKRQTVIIGQVCTQSTECGTGAYCTSMKRCDCLSSYVAINGYCWKKINPDETGCQYPQQCSAVWPESVCQSGTCRCANNQPGTLTRDGSICVNYGFCPTGGRNVQNPDAQGCGTGTVTDIICGEMYDCICTDSSCTQQGICCPTRALSCIQPRNQGTGGGGSVTRYYFNPVSRLCETFTYSGSGGNGNNFYTLDQCRSYCLDTCERGHPQYNLNQIVSGSSSRASVVTCSTSAGSGAGCASNYQCTNIGTNNICCPSVAFICSRNGGRDYLANTYGEYPPTTNYDPGTAHPAVVSSTRYYYDVTTKMCQQFTYNGLYGNFNNFLSTDQCTAFCARSVCQYGTALTDNMGVSRTCLGGCPSGYTCTSNNCCPTQQTVCSLPQQAGPCFQYVQRWFFNSATGNCQSFTYSGCQGNDNNFETYTTCASTCNGISRKPQCVQGDAYATGTSTYLICGGTGQTTSTCPTGFECYYDGFSYGCCPTSTYTCSLSYSSGTACKTPVTRYYYSSTTRSCSTYTYLGCGGNSNNFATQQDCQEYCGVGGCPYGGTPASGPTGTYTVCGSSLIAGASTGVATCPTNFFCTPVTTYTGANSMQTNNYCCPTRTSVCLSSRLEGTLCTSTPITRWWFNSVTKACEQFTYGGCGGNRNNFATQTQCLNYCMSADCPDGQIAQMTTTTGSTINSLGQVVQSSITAGSLATCAVGGTCSDSRYSCVSSKIFGGGVCCGSNAPIDACPAGQSAWVEATSGTPRTCTANVLGACPANYACLYSSTQRRYYCCGTPASSICTNGGQPYYYPGTVQPYTCTPNTATNLCATLGATYTCVPRTVVLNGITSVTGTCCGPPQTTSVCGTGYDPYLTTSITGPVRCNPSTANICPSPSTCVGSPGQTGVYYCCVTTATVSNVCPTNYAAQTYNNNPVLCTTTGTTATCNAGYTCMLFSGNGNYYCCTPGAATAGPTTDPCLLVGGGAYRSPLGGASFVSCTSAATCTTYGSFYCVSTARGNFCCGSTTVATTVGPTADPQGCPTGFSFVPYAGTRLPLSCTGKEGQCPNSQCMQSSIPGNNMICCATIAG